MKRVLQLNYLALFIIVFILNICSHLTAWANLSTEIPTWGDIPEPLLSSLLSLLGVIIPTAVAWGIAIWTLQKNEKIQKRRITIDYISNLSWSNDYTQVRRKFLELKATRIDFSKIAEDYHALPKKRSTARNVLSLEEQTIIDNHEVIRKILNEYESMAGALKIGAYDEDIIKMSKKQAVLSDLRTCGTFIGATRTARGVKNEYPNPEAIYNECCDLYKEWSGKNLETLK